MTVVKENLGGDGEVAYREAERTSYRGIIQS